MKTKELEELGLTEEVIKKVFAMNGKDIEEFKKQLEEKAKEVEDLTKANQDTKKLFDDLSEKMKGFEGVDVDGMKNEILKLQQDMEKQKVDFENQKLERAFQDKLDACITKKLGKNVTAIKSLLDVNALRDSKNQDADIEGAIDSVAKDNDYLFGSNEPIKKPVLGTGNNDNNDLGTEGIAMARKVMGLPPLKN